MNHEQQQTLRKLIDVLGEAESNGLMDFIAKQSHPDIPHRFCDIMLLADLYYLEPKLGWERKPC